MQIIIYKDDSGRVAVVNPNPTYIASHGIHAVAQVLVPSGKPYKIADSSDLPADRSQRAGWTCDDAELTDGHGTAADRLEGAQP